VDVAPLTERRWAGGRMKRASALVALVLLAISLPTWPIAAGASVGPGAVRLTVDDVFPDSPAISVRRQELTFSLTISSLTSTPLRNVTVTGRRGDPISTQTGLDAAIKTGRSTNIFATTPLTSRNLDLAPFGSTSVTIATSTSAFPHANGVCLCHNAIYPMVFAATVVVNGAPLVLATAQTYIPVFEPHTEPTKMNVTWVWPLLDRPHRVVHSNVFSDDELATEVAPGGRLDHLLTTLERVASSRPSLTVLTDPEVIDELAVMTQGYKVKTGDGIVPGTGGAAAQEWLSRLRAVLGNGNIELAWTPIADPAVDALTRRQMSWSTNLDTATTDRIQAAIGRTPQYDINWPVGEVAHGSTLARLLMLGTRLVVLKDLALTAPLTDPANALTTISTSQGPVTAAVTSARIEKRVRSVLDPAGPGLAMLPTLVAELAIQVETGLHTPHYVVITPPRMLDVNPTVAARTIEATTATPWSRSVGLRAATAAIGATQASAVRQDLHTHRIAGRVLRTLRYVLRTVPRLTGLFPSPDDAKTQLGGLRAAVQRCESTGMLPYPSEAYQHAQQLRWIVRRVRHGVSLVAPAASTYTLTSNDADLPITIRNRLDEDVQVRIAMSQPQGFSASGLDRLHTIPAGSRVDVRVPTHVDRVGLIPIAVSLRTPEGLKLGKSMPLTIRSTALGTIGVVITIVAGCVLALALIIRFTRRMRARGRTEPTGPTPPAPPDAATTEPAGTTAP
jgi:Family of unknown function (DUF6049)